MELFEYHGVSVVDHKLMKAGLGSTLSETDPMGTSIKCPS